MEQNAKRFSNYLLISHIFTSSLYSMDPEVDKRLASRLVAVEDTIRRTNDDLSSVVRSQQELQQSLREKEDKIRDLETTIRTMQAQERESERRRDTRLEGELERINNDLKRTTEEIFRRLGRLEPKVNQAIEGINLFRRRSAKAAGHVNHLWDHIRPGKSSGVDRCSKASWHIEAMLYELIGNGWVVNDSMAGPSTRNPDNSDIASLGDDAGARRFLDEIASQREQARQSCMKQAELQAHIEALNNKIQEITIQLTTGHQEKRQLQARVDALADIFRQAQEDRTPTRQRLSPSAVAQVSNSADDARRSQSPGTRQVKFESQEP